MCSNTLNLCCRAQINLIYNTNRSIFFKLNKIEKGIYCTKIVFSYVYFHLKNLQIILIVSYRELVIKNSH